MRPVPRTVSGAAAVIVVRSVIVRVRGTVRDFVVVPLRLAMGVRVRGMRHTMFGRDHRRGM